MTVAPPPSARRKPRIPARRRLLISALAAPFVIVVAATVLEASGLHPTGRDRPAAHPRLDVRISSPIEGEAVQRDARGTLTVRAVTSGVPLVGARLSSRPGSEAYALFQLDGGRYDFPRYADTEAEEQLLRMSDPIQFGHAPDSAPLSAGTFSPSPNGRLTYHDIPVGDHTLTVWLLRGDHVVLSPYDSVRFKLVGDTESRALQNRMHGSTSGGGVTRCVAGARHARSARR